jgi:hypothetical protein
LIATTANTTANANEIVVLDVAYRNHLHAGRIGLQDHGSPYWTKNIKIKPLTR